MDHEPWPFPVSIQKKKMARPLFLSSSTPADLEKKKAAQPLQSTDLKGVSYNMTHSVVGVSEPWNIKKTNQYMINTHTEKRDWMYDKIPPDFVQQQWLLMLQVKQGWESLDSVASTSGLLEGE